MIFSERRSRSLELEFLWVYYIGILQKHLKQLKFSRVWENIQHGLQLYPNNPEMLDIMVEISYFSTVPNKVRLVFDEYIERYSHISTYPIIIFDGRYVTLSPMCIIIFFFHALIRQCIFFLFAFVMFEIV